MLRLVFLFTLTAIACNLAKGQSTLVSTGNSVRSGDRVVEYSVGQISIETIKSSGNVITQGVLQPNIRVTVFVNEHFDNKYQLKVFPNPTMEMLNISTDYPLFTAYTILDMQGRLVKSGSFQNESIDLSPLTNGTYILNIFSKDISKTLQVIKQ